MVFIHFFDSKETFKALAESYIEDKFELKTCRGINALKILDRVGFTTSCIGPEAFRGEKLN